MRSLWLAVMLSALPSAAAAQALELDFQGGVMKLATPDSDVGGTLEGGLAYRSAEWLRVAIHAGWHSASSTVSQATLSGPLSERVHLRAARFGITVRLEIPLGRFRPFLEPGFELLRWTSGIRAVPLGADSGGLTGVDGPFVDTAVLIGGGLRVALIDRMSITARIRGTLSASSNAFENEAREGARFVTPSNVMIFDAMLGLAITLTKPAAPTHEDEAPVDATEPDVDEVEDDEPTATELEAADEPEAIEPPETVEAPEAAPRDEFDEEFD